MDSATPTKSRMQILNEEGQNVRFNAHGQEHPSGSATDANATKPINLVAADKQAESHSQSQSHEKTNGALNDAEKAGEDKEPGEVKEPDGGDDQEEKKGPAGGYDSSPIPYRPSGYTVMVTIHSATNLPMADLNSLSSDPYVVAEVQVDNPNVRHREDPRLTTRTPTVRRSTDPEWNADWIVANIPASGFRLKLRLYDEDPADRDDRLGNVHVNIPSMSETWEGIDHKQYDIEKRSGSKRAYLVRAVATCFRVAKHMHGILVLSVRVLGKTPEDGQNGRLYTLGPQWWTKHYSPLLGRLTNTYAPDMEGAKKDQQEVNRDPDVNEKPTARRYDFQANQMQLRGPVPPELYHRYVEFKPWAKRMFTNSGLQGFVLSKALHHQHARVYNFDRSTQWGHFSGHVDKDVTRQFLELARWDQGARIFTYVLTLDALLRFTETGKEFGIDMLSKHTMHSDVSIYIAFSGEFMIRRLKHPRRPPPPEPTEPSSQHPESRVEENPSHPPEQLEDGPPFEEGPRDPEYYELIIDNDSGTYRPNAALLPVLKAFLAANLPGLHIMTLDCNADAEKMQKMKSQQRERKKREGDHIVYRQRSRGSSVSSSDVEDLDEVEQDYEGEGGGEGHAGGNARHERSAFGQYARDTKIRQSGRWNKAKRDYVPGVGREGVSNHPDMEAGAERADGVTEGRVAG